MFRACGRIEGGTREGRRAGLKGAIYSLVYSVTGGGLAIIRNTFLFFVVFEL